MKFRPLALAVLGCALVFQTAASAQVAERKEGLAALSPEALAKPRPKPPFDTTGVWQQDLKPRDGVRQSFAFGPPYPEVQARGAEGVRRRGRRPPPPASAYKRLHRPLLPGRHAGDHDPGLADRHDPAADRDLHDLGFENAFRAIYLDGRKHMDPDVVVRSYNGESIGHWEGDTLVVDTIAFETSHHTIDVGLPISDDFHMVEKVKMVDTQDPDPAAGVLNRRQHEQAGAGQGDGLEEVAGDQGISLGAEKTGPGWCRCARVRGRCRLGGGSPRRWRQRP